MRNPGSCQSVFQTGMEDAVSVAERDSPSWIPWQGEDGKEIEPSPALRHLGGHIKLEVVALSDLSVVSADKPLLGRRWSAFLL
jgi:hypothetical protein